FYRVLELACPKRSPRAPAFFFSASPKVHADQRPESLFPNPLYPSPSRNPAALSSLPLPTPHPTLPFVNTMRLPGRPLLFLRILPMLLLSAFAMGIALGQQPVQKPLEKPSEKKVEEADAPEKTENPAQIELLETRYRFEGNGDS